MLLHISPTPIIISPSSSTSSPLASSSPPKLFAAPSTSSSIVVKASANGRPPSTLAAAQQRRPMSGFEARASLVIALASQAASTSQRLLADLVTETAKYVFPKRFESRNLEEALMSVPDLETVKFKVLSRTDEYEIREVEPYFVAETTMPGKSGFDFNGASQSFNALAEYLFGKNTTQDKMEMTTPVFTRKGSSDGEKMEMTTPVITRKEDDKEIWKMSFVMPSKYGADLPLPKNPSVSIKYIPRRILAVVAFSGFVTDEEVASRELKLRDALRKDGTFQVKQSSPVEIAQYNPPFTLPFQRRNEIALEVERKQVSP
uniref:SOUL heme-binding protein n=1 Tax=Kalanchoe fedtschenkoi TaxID=63787 RepID=A0A7N0V4A6_KALFE